MKGNKYEYVVHQSHAAMALAGRGDAPSGSARGRSPSSRHDGGVRQGNGDGVIGRKSQITLFIIIGLVIILAVGATIYITRTVEFQRETAIPQAEQISTQFEPVRQYIQSCLRQTGIQALQLIGQQGGYAYPEEQGIIAIEQAPTESTAVTFSRDVPYWHYLESRNSCSGDCRLSNRLHLRLLGDTAVNKELDKYINRELANCLDFTALNAQGFTITMAGSPESRTVIGESDVTFSAQLPVDIRQGNARQKMEQFVSPLGYNFKALYDTASQLADEMISSSFLELATLTMIDSLDGTRGGTEGNNLPPLAQTDFSHRFSYWLLPDLRADLTNELASIIPYSRVRDTPGYQDIPAATPLQQGVYGNFQFQPAAPIPYQVRFHYLSWQPYLDFGQGQLLTPTTIGALPILSAIIPPVQNYNFAYDLSYPVVVELIDENVPLEFNGPYSFLFALEVNIRNNQPVDDSTLNILFSSDEPLFCNPRQWTNPATITVSDGASPVPDAEVTFTVGGQRCPIGITNSQGILEAGFPAAIGQLDATKPGYFSSAQLFSPSQQSATILLQQLQTINLQAKKIPFRKPGWQPQAAASLLESEEAVISITRIGEPGEEELNEAVIISGSSQQSISLVPGTYQLSATLIRHLEQPYIIPASQKKYDTLPFVPFAGDKTIDIPELTFAESFPAGGLVFDESNAWSSQPSGNTLTIKVIGFEPSDFTIVDDLEQLDKIDDYSLQYRQQLLPEWSP